MGCHQIDTLKSQDYVYSKHDEKSKHGLKSFIKKESSDKFDSRSVSDSNQEAQSNFSNFSRKFWAQNYKKQKSEKSPNYRVKDYKKEMGDIEEKNEYNSFKSELKDSEEKIGDGNIFSNNHNDFKFTSCNLDEATFNNGSSNNNNLINRRDKKIFTVSSIENMMLVERIFRADKRKRTILAKTQKKKDENSRKSILKKIKKTKILQKLKKSILQENLKSDILQHLVNDNYHNSSAIKKSNHINTTKPPSKDLFKGLCNNKPLKGNSNQNYKNSAKVSVIPAMKSSFYKENTRSNSSNTEKKISTKKTKLFFKDHVRHSKVNVFNNQIFGQYLNNESGSEFKSDEINNKENSNESSILKSNI